jgi:hypothetical protein
MAREHQFSYAISNQTIEIQCILSYQEIIDRHYIVVLDAFDLGQKGKGVGWLKKQMCLIAYRGSYE